MKSSLWKMKGTLLILAVWIITFVVSQFFDFPPLFCGKGLDRIGGEYYRIFTGAMLHTNAVHLAANCLVLFWIGRYLEIHIGSGAYLGLGILSCVLAEGIFLAIYKKPEASCGGSVFPFSFMGWILVLQFRAEFPRFRLGTWYGNWIGIYAVAANIPLFSFTDATTLALHGIALGTGVILGGVFVLCGLGAGRQKG